MHVETIVIAGLSVELRRAGAGEKLLFLHAGDGAAPAERLIGELAKTYSVVAPSHPGFDGSDLPDHFSTVEDLGYFYLDLIEALGLDDALEQVARLQSLEHLEQDLGAVQGPADLAAIDRAELGELLGEESIRELEALERLEIGRAHV